MPNKPSGSSIRKSQGDLIDGDNVKEHLWRRALSATHRHGSYPHCEAGPALLSACSFPAVRAPCQVTLDLRYKCAKYVMCADWYTRAGLFIRFKPNTNQSHCSSTCDLKVNMQAGSTRILQHYFHTHVHTPPTHRQPHTHTHTPREHKLSITTSTRLAQRRFQARRNDCTCPGDPCEP